METLSRTALTGMLGSLLSAWYALGKLIRPARKQKAGSADFDDEYEDVCSAIAQYERMRARTTPAAGPARRGSGRSSGDGGLLRRPAA